MLSMFAMKFLDDIQIIRKSGKRFWRNQERICANNNVFSKYHRLNIVRCFITIFELLAIGGKSSSVMESGVLVPHLLGMSGISGV